LVVVDDLDVVPVRVERERAGTEIDSELAAFYPALEDVLGGFASAGDESLPQRSSQRRGRRVSAISATNGRLVFGRLNRRITLRICRRQRCTGAAGAVAWRRS
jgi:hypothetical protein